MAEITVKKYLSKLPPELRSVAAELCVVARKNMPGAHEIIYHDAVGYSTSGSQKKGYVNFGFFFGATLLDPKKLLDGNGKRMRYVKVKSVGEAKSPTLRKLVAAMWKEAPESIEKIHNKKKR